MFPLPYEENLETVLCAILFRVIFFLFYFFTFFTKMILPLPERPESLYIRLRKDKGSHALTTHLFAFPAK